MTAALCLSLSLADDDSARLLASKHVLNMMLVQEKDITIEYEIFNVGGRYYPNYLLRQVKSNLVSWVPISEIMSLLSLNFVQLSLIFDNLQFNQAA